MVESLFDNLCDNPSNPYNYLKTFVLFMVIWVHITYVSLGFVQIKVVEGDSNGEVWP